MQFHLTEMRQGENEEALQGLTSTIGTNISEGAYKTDSLFSSACIYRVPKELRKVKESAYTPRLIAIGPLHQKDKHLKTPLQGVKKSYTNNLLLRLTAVKMEGSETKYYEYPKVLQECVKEMKDCVDKAKKCYAEELDVSDDHLLEMMLVDGCFILELLYRFFHESKYIPKEAKNVPKEEGHEGKRNGASTSSNLLTPLLQVPSERLLSSSFSEYIPKEAKNIPEEEGQEGKRNGASTSSDLSTLLLQASNGTTRMHGTTKMLGTTKIQRPLGGESQIGEKNIDPIGHCNLTATTIQTDLILLENQIPFFVLEKLFRLTVDRIQNSHHRKFSLDDYVFQYFDGMLSPEENSTSSGGAMAPTSRGSAGDSTVLRISLDQMKSFEEDGVLTSNAQRYYYHILHKLHDYYLPQTEPDGLHEDYHPQDQTNKKKGTEEEDREIMPCASELEYAGVKFETVRGKDLFKVEFSEPKGLFWWCHMARFKIPFLEIYDNTELFLRNLIAFEQSCPRVSKHFTSYALLMDTLVNSEKDVDVLEKARVMRNYLGARADATNLFNNLCKEVALDQEREFFFADKCKKASTYTERRWPKNLAHVQRTWFASPWTFIAFVLAFITFAIQIVTFVQSFL